VFPDIREGASISDEMKMIIIKASRLTLLVLFIGILLFNRIEATFMDTV